MIGNAFSIAALMLVGLAFAHALMHKLRDLPRFTRSVRDYDLLPGRLAVPASLFLVLAELSTVFLIVIALLFPSARDGLIARIGLAAAALLLALYGVAMAINLARRQFGLDCGCTSGGTPISAGLVVRNLAVAGVAVVAVLIRAPEPDALALGILAGTALFLGYLTVTQLLSNRLQGNVLR